MEEQDEKETTKEVSQPIHDQITDAVTESNVKTLDEAPAVAMGTIYQNMAHTTGIMFENAVNNQNQQDELGQAATNQGVMQIYGMDTTADAISIAKMLDEEDVKGNNDGPGDKGTGGGNNGSGGKGGNG